MSGRPPGSVSAYDCSAIADDRTLPAALEQAHLIWLSEFDHWHNFEPDDMFEEAGTTTKWWRAETNNQAADAPFRVFGRDGSGGWRRPGSGNRKPLSTPSQSYSSAQRARSRSSRGTWVTISGFWEAVSGRWSRSLVWIEYRNPFPRSSCWLSSTRVFRQSPPKQ
jgi:hypothetical protein